MDPFINGCSVFWWIAELVFDIGMESVNIDITRFPKGDCLAFWVWLPPGETTENTAVVGKSMVNNLS